MPDSLNLSRLREVAMDDPAFMAELAEMFLTEAGSQVASLRQELASERWSDAGRTAHRLRGASSNVGAERLALECEEIERLVGANGPVDPAMGEGVTAEFTCVQAALAECIARGRGER